MTQSTEPQHIVVIAGAFIGVARRTPREDAPAASSADEALEAFEQHPKSEPVRKPVS